MTEERRTAIMKRAIDTYGRIAQLNLVVEEMAELTKAICKLRRASPGPEFRAAVENIVEETADVQIMIDQLRMILDFSTTLAEEEKLQRLDGRLDAYVAEKGAIEATRPGSSWWCRGQRTAGTLEGSSWHWEAKRHGVTLRAKMIPGKVYLYQLYTEIFAEFDSVEQANRFRETMTQISPMWDYDPVATIDTTDPAQAARWADHMEGVGTSE